MAVSKPIFLTKAVDSYGQIHYIGPRMWGYWGVSTVGSTSTWYPYYDLQTEGTPIGYISADWFKQEGDRLTLANGSYFECTDFDSNIGGGSGDGIGILVKQVTYDGQNLGSLGIFKNNNIPLNTAGDELTVNYNFPEFIISNENNDTISSYEEYINLMNDIYLNGKEIKTLSIDALRYHANINDTWFGFITSSKSEYTLKSARALLALKFWGTNANGVTPELVPTTYTDDISSTETGDDSFYPDLFENDNLTPESMTGTISVSDMGGLHLYSPNFVEIQAFRNYMWSTPFTSFLETAQKLFQSPEEMIITLHGIPAEIPLNEGKIGITFGSLISDTATSSTIKQQYISVDCGTISIPKIWGNFLDFEPYTKISLYLPYCSTIDISANEAVGNDINVVYNIDVLTGDCVAQICVHSEEQGFDWIIASVQGNCALQVPWSAGNYSQSISDSMRLLASVGMSTLSNATMSNQQTKSPTDNSTELDDNIGGIAPPNAFGVTIAPKISRGGTHSTAFGYLDKQKPHALITRPIQSYPAGYPHEYGLPSNINEKLGNLKGFTVVDKITLQGIPATSDELSQIESALMNGVIIT